MKKEISEQWLESKLITDKRIGKYQLIFFSIATLFPVYSMIAIGFSWDALLGMIVFILLALMGYSAWSHNKVLLEGLRSD